MDFEDANSTDRAAALNICKGVLHSRTEDEALELWDRLRKIAGRLRRAGGGIDLPRLADELRRDFWLRDVPDHEPDIASRLEAGRVAVVIGASGVGKSALAKRMALSAMQRGKALWMDAERLVTRSLSEWRGHLGLRFPLAELVGTVPAPSALIVVDGLDRLHAETGFATVAELIAAARIEDDGTPWRVLITCTPEEWARVREQLAARGISLPEPISLSPPAADDLAGIWTAFPQLAARRYWICSPRTSPQRTTSPSSENPTSHACSGSVKSPAAPTPFSVRTPLFRSPGSTRTGFGKKRPRPPSRLVGKASIWRQ
jgi:hypothetical protein